MAARCCSCCMLRILAEDTTTELEVPSKDGFSREKSLERKHGMTKQVKICV